MRKIAMILSTNGIQYDDRIRKEMLSVMSIYPDIKFKIFAMIDGNVSIEDSGISDYGVEYEIPLFKSRLKYPQGTHLMSKLWDFYKTIQPKITDFDAVWLADFRPLFFVLLCGKPKVWDMHELPEIFLGNSFKKFLLKILMKRADVIIHANSARLKYLEGLNALSNKESQFIIRNYPELNDVQDVTDDKLSDFISWKGDIPCIYLQGLSESTRCDYESVKAILSINNVKGIVVGKFSKDLKDKLRSEYGHELNDKLFFTGMVPQMMTSYYLKECIASLVLYKNTNPNNYYCEPNRMFQSIMNDCPVVVGCNPPMREIVDKYSFGVSLDTDGSNISHIVDGLMKVIKKREFYLENIKRNKQVILWNHQNDIFKTIIDKLFKN